jgi:hypothetical protein
MTNPDLTSQKGHARVHLVVQPSRMGRVRGGRHHDFFRPVEYDDRKFLEKPSDKADEVQGQTFPHDERIIGEYQEVLKIFRRACNYDASWC